MILNPKYKLREIAGETAIIKQGKVGTELTKIITLNESAKLLYEELKDKDFSEEDAKQVLLNNYEIDSELAEKDSLNWIKQLKEIDVII